MNRCIFKLALLLILGVVINIAVAWGCGLWSVPRVDSMVHGTSALSESPDVADSPLSIWRVQGPGIEKMHVTTWVMAELPESYQPLEDVQPFWVSPRDVTLGQIDEDAYAGFAYAQGWPMFALRAEMPDERTTLNGIFISHRQVPGTFLSIEHLLALRPIWPGFVINSSLFATTLWLLIFLPFTVRRRLRVRCNRCPKCGYPIGKSSTCSECGASLQL